MRQFLVTIGFKNVSIRLYHGTLHVELFIWIFNRKHHCSNRHILTYILPWTRCLHWIYKNTYLFRIVNLHQYPLATLLVTTFYQLEICHNHMFGILWMVISTYNFHILEAINECGSARICMENAIMWHTWICNWWIQIVHYPIHHIRLMYLSQFAWHKYLSPLLIYQFLLDQLYVMFLGTIPVIMQLSKPLNLLW